MTWWAWLLTLWLTAQLPLVAAWSRIVRWLKGGAR